MIVADYVVVGAGLTGATVARLLSDAGRDVVVVERRAVVGGNVADARHASGFLYHLYGPHYFLTDSAPIWDFATRFAAFRHFRPQVRCAVDGELAAWPVRARDIARLAGPGWQPALADSAEPPRNFDEAMLRRLPRAVYRRFIAGYTAKQWGCPPHVLDAGLADRITVRTDDDPALSLCRFQGVPAEGYSPWIGAMLAGIPVRLQCDYLRERADCEARIAVVYTGAIDELFGFCHGRLRYRTQRRDLRFVPDIPGSLQPCVQVNHPAPDVPYLRTVEWKHLPHAGNPLLGTLVTTETPCDRTGVDDCEYPFPSADDRALYERYRELAAATPGLVVGGRLGDYRYYNMDAAILRGQAIAADLLAGPAP